MCQQAPVCRDGGLPLQRSEAIENLTRRLEKITRPDSGARPIDRFRRPHHRLLQLARCLLRDTQSSGIP